MINLISVIGRRNDGASAIEFAFAAPILFLLLFGIAQLGIIFFANADLNNAMAQGARLATIYPRPTEENVRNAIDTSRWGIEREKLTVNLQYVTATPPAFAQIQMSYPVELKFPFFEGPQITLQQNRRVYLQPLPPS